MAELTETITIKEREALEAIAKEIKARFPTEKVIAITENYMITFENRRSR